MTLHADKKTTFTLSILSVALLSSALTTLGCTESTQQDLADISTTPTLRAAGSHRFLIEDDPIVDDNCESGQDGQLTCFYDDGEGTTCSYLLDADGVLLDQVCTGPWGRYDCVNEGAVITCLLDTGGGSCTDTWSLDYELVDSDCDYGQRVPDDMCTPQDDGTQLCNWNEDGVDCTVLLDADGSLISQICGDERFTYTCLAGDEVVSCALVLDGAEVCEDTWTPEGEPLEFGCEAYFGSEPQDAYEDCTEECTDDRCVETCDPHMDDPMEECSPQDDGTTLCTWTDGVTDCSVVLDAQERLVSQTCSDGTQNYDCSGDAEQVVCTLSIDGEEQCQDLWTQQGEPIELGCEDVFGDGGGDSGGDGSGR